MTNIEVVRLVAEVIGLLSVVVGGVLAISFKINHLLSEVREMKELIGPEENPRPNTIRGQLKHQDTCTDSLKGTVLKQGEDEQ